MSPAESEGAPPDAAANFFDKNIRKIQCTSVHVSQIGNQIQALNWPTGPIQRL